MAASVSRIERFLIRGRSRSPIARHFVHRADALENQTEIAAHARIVRGVGIQRAQRSQGRGIANLGIFRTAKVRQVRVAQQVAHLQLRHGRLQSIFGGREASAATAANSRPEISMWVSAVDVSPAQARTSDSRR